MTLAKALLLILMTSQFALAEQRANARAVAGQESHGGSGHIVESALAGGLGSGPVTELFDVIEYDKEFMVGDLAEYAKVIKPNLDIFKGKLPRTGHFLEEILLRGISPRWYWVKYKLKSVPKEDGDTSNLITTFEEVQIALNDGRKVQIDENFWKTLEAPRATARLLIHELVRSAVGFNYPQPTDMVKSIASLLLHKNLDKFSKKDLGEALLDDLGRCHNEEGACPFYKLVDADLNFSTQVYEAWSDLSLLEDGLTPTSCSYQTDQCAFKDKARGTIWTKVYRHLKRGSTKSLQEAQDACKEAKPYAGYTEWKMPTFSQLMDAAPRLKQLASLVSPFGDTTTPTWTSSSPFADPWTPVLPVDVASDKGWVINIESSDPREAFLNAKAGWHCVRNAARNWLDVTKKADGTPGSCTLNEDQCTLKSTRTDFLWSEPGPNYKHRYKGERRPEDQGQVSRPVAFNQCRRLNWNGVAKGWRLPTTRELQDAVREQLFSVPLEMEKFGNLRGFFWVDNSGFASVAGRLDPAPTDEMAPGSSGLARTICVHEPLTPREETPATVHVPVEVETEQEVQQ